MSSLCDFACEGTEVQRGEEMNKVLQFRRGSMGLAFALPNYRLFCCNPMHARMHGQGYCRQQNLSGESVWSGCEKGGLRAGDPACHCSPGPVGRKSFLPDGARTDTRNPVWPSCLPCRRSQAHILSHHPTPTSPGPQAPASWRVMAVCMST